ncbi:MAG: hypothetical protein V1820_03695, partial [archaeon]
MEERGKIGMKILALALLAALAVFSSAYAADCYWGPSTCQYDPWSGYLCGGVASGCTGCDPKSGPAWNPCTCYYSGYVCCSSCASPACQGGGFCSCSDYCCSTCAATTTTTVATTSTTTTTTIPPACSDSSPVIVKVDTSAPATGSVSCGAYSTTSTNTLTIANGTDSDSGVSTTRIWSRSGSLSGNSCSGYGSWSVLLTSPPASYGHSVTAGNCYDYFHQTINGASAETNSSTATTKADLTAPNSTISVPARNSYWKLTISASGASQDIPNYAGVASVEVYNGTGWSAATGTTSWTKDIDSTQLTGGYYYIKSRATDNAGNILAQDEGFSNLDFETGTVPNPPTSWTGHIYGAWNLTTGDKLAGTSAKSVNGSTTAVRNWVCQQKAVSAVDGKIYNLTGYLKGVGLGDYAFLTLNFSDASYVNLLTVDSNRVIGTTDWTFVYANGTAPSGTAYIDICVTKKSGAGHVLADNLAITRADNMNVVQIIVDNTAPTAGTVSVPAYNSSTWILATITNGTDALSGVA